MYMSRLHLDPAEMEVEDAGAEVAEAEAIDAARVIHALTAVFIPYLL
jgi:hypothetical protein